MAIEVLCNKIWFVNSNLLDLYDQESEDQKDTVKIFKRQH